MPWVRAMGSASARIRGVTSFREFSLPLGELQKYTLSRAPRSSAPAHARSVLGAIDRRSEECDYPGRVTGIIAE